MRRGERWGSLEKQFGSSGEKSLVASESRIDCEGLSVASISRRVKAAARASALGAGYSGHSGRVGMTRRRLCRGRRGPPGGGRPGSRSIRRPARAVGFPAGATAAQLQAGRFLQGVADGVAFCRRAGVAFEAVDAQGLFSGPGGVAEYQRCRRRLVSAAVAVAAGAVAGAFPARAWETGCDFGGGGEGYAIGCAVW